jgi:hypothetical protein
MLGSQDTAELEKEVALHPSHAHYHPPDPMRDHWQWRRVDPGAFDDSGTYSQPQSGTIACSLSNILGNLEAKT